MSVLDRKPSSLFRRMYDALGWQFFAAVACLVPIAYAVGTLQWFYIWSLSLARNGMVIYFGAAIQAPIGVWAVFRCIAMFKENRKAGRTSQFPRTVLPMMLPLFALISLQAPIVGIAIAKSNIPATPNQFRQVANEWRQKNLGF